MRRLSLSILLAGLIAAGCSTPKAVLTEDMLRYEGDMPADFSGSWARDWARSDDIEKVWRDTVFELQRKRSGGNPYYGRQDRAGIVIGGSRPEQSLMPLARLAELITRPDELTISQTDESILIERLDDYAISCSFYDRVSRDSGSPYGREICGWDGDRLVSHLELPDGLEVTYRFTISDDRKQLRMQTTVASDTAAVPFTLTHYYWRFEKATPRYQCIETLSMKRVCATGDLAP